jgi:hypothetical protein
MKWSSLRVSLFAAALFVALLCWTSSAVGAANATATAVLQPGRLTISNAPAILSYATSTTDTTRVLDATFGLHVTDATGSRAGWHIQASLGLLTSASGAPVAAFDHTIVNADVATETGRAPVSQLSYPRSFRPQGDTIFSAAAGSGAGKSSLTFSTQASIPAQANSDSYVAALTVTIVAGP